MSESIARTVFRGWSVVVVDDDPLSLDLVRIILEHYGATVATASNGQDGLALVRRLHPRFVISDLSMPVVDGWQMVHALKSDAATRAIPVIALTAHAMVGDRERALAAGCNSYLSKPLSPSSFIRDLVQLLQDIPALNIAS